MDSNNLDEYQIPLGEDGFELDIATIKSKINECETNLTNLSVELGEVEERLAINGEDKDGLDRFKFLKNNCEKNKRLIRKFNRMLVSKEYQSMELNDLIKLYEEGQMEIEPIQTNLEGISSEMGNTEDGETLNELNNKARLLNQEIRYKQEGLQHVNHFINIKKSASQPTPTVRNINKEQTPLKNSISFATVTDSEKGAISKPPKSSEVKFGQNSPLHLFPRASGLDVGIRGGRNSRRGGYSSRGGRGSRGNYANYYDNYIPDELMKLNLENPKELTSQSQVYASPIYNRNVTKPVIPQPLRYNLELNNNHGQEINNFPNVLQPSVTTDNSYLPQNINPQGYTIPVQTFQQPITQPYSRPFQQPISQPFQQPIAQPISQPFQQHNQQSLSNLSQVSDPNYNYDPSYYPYNSQPNYNHSHQQHSPGYVVCATSFNQPSRDRDLYYSQLQQNPNLTYNQNLNNQPLFNPNIGSQSAPQTSQTPQTLPPNNSNSNQAMNNNPPSIGQADPLTSNIQQMFIRSQLTNTFAPYKGKSREELNKYLEALLNYVVSYVGPLTSANAYTVINQLNLHMGEELKKLTEKIDFFEMSVEDYLNNVKSIYSIANKKRTTNNKENFTYAKLEHGDSLISLATRLRMLARKAYPNKSEAELDSESDVFRRFHALVPKKISKYMDSVISNLESGEQDYPRNWNTLVRIIHNISNRFEEYEIDKMFQTKIEQINKEEKTEETNKPFFFNKKGAPPYKTVIAKVDLDGNIINTMDADISHSQTENNNEAFNPINFPTINESIDLTGRVQYNKNNTNNNPLSSDQIKKLSLAAKENFTKRNQLLSITWGKPVCFCCLDYKHTTENCLFLNRECYGCHEKAHVRSNCFKDAEIYVSGTFKL